MSGVELNTTLYFFLVFTEDTRLDFTQKLSSSVHCRKVQLLQSSDIDTKEGKGPDMCIPMYTDIYNI